VNDRMAIELFGLVAVTSMVLTYAFEHRSRVYILGFAISCAAASIYAMLIHSWPFAAVEAVWTVVAAKRWLSTRDRSKA
jgi:hypothetical protein